VVELSQGGIPFSARDQQQASRTRSSRNSRASSQPSRSSLVRVEHRLGIGEPSQRGEHLDLVGHMTEESRLGIAVFDQQVVDRFEPCEGFLMAPARELDEPEDPPVKSDQIVDSAWFVQL
jgi:hypothetical protein